MNWKAIDVQRDLDALNQQICWDDSTVREYYATLANQAYFPADINRSGYQCKNLHILCEACGNCEPFLELVLIHCDWAPAHAIDRLHMMGRVDSLKRVEIVTGTSTMVRCARIIYRFLDEDKVHSFTYFRHSDSVSEQ